MVVNEAKRIQLQMWWNFSNYFLFIHGYIGANPLTMDCKLNDSALWLLTTKPSELEAALAVERQISKKKE